jgi:hypothetical protein
VIAVAGSGGTAGLAQGDLTPDWFDQVAVDRAIAGRPVGRPLSTAERRAVAREMDQRGIPHHRIAARLNCNWDQVPALLNPTSRERM